MKKCDDLYGSKTLTPAELSDLVGETLDLSFKLRESSYRGVYYLAGNLRGEHFEVQANQIPDEEEEEEDDVLEPAYSDFPSLLSVNGTLRGDDIRSRLEKIEDLIFLRRETP